MLTVLRPAVSTTFNLLLQTAPWHCRAPRCGPRVAMAGPGAALAAGLLPGMLPGPVALPCHTRSILG